MYARAMYARTLFVARKDELRAIRRIWLTLDREQAALGGRKQKARRVYVVRKEPG
jgi:hypothetical protein